MLLKAQDENAEIIEKVLAHLRNSEAKGKIQAETFIRQYYSQVDPEDLAERSISNLCGAALAHLDFMEEFKSGAPKLRVYNPQSQKDGWESTHTVIEIVNDDMPFLVDSVTMEVNRQGLTLHLIIQPVMNTKRDANGGLIEILPREAGQRRCFRIGHARRSGPANRSRKARRAGSRNSAYTRGRAQGGRRLLEDEGPHESACRRERRALSGSARFRRQLEEDKALLAWLADGHFIFLGYRDYDLVKEG